MAVGTAVVEGVPVTTTVATAVVEGVVVPVTTTVATEVAGLTVGTRGLLFRAQAMGKIPASMNKMALKICFFIFVLHLS
jgi:hypothetical protein